MNSGGLLKTDSVQYECHIHTHTNTEIDLSSLVENIEEAHVKKGIWIQITRMTQNSGFVVFGLVCWGFLRQSVYSNPFE